MKTHCTEQELIELIYPKPWEKPGIIGDRLNKNQLAQAHCVCLQTVTGWMQRGCPILERKGREVFFDSLRVLNWREARKYADKHGLIALDRDAMVEKMEQAATQLLIWIHSDSARASDEHACLALHMMNGVIQNLKGRGRLNIEDRAA